MAAERDRPDDGRGLRCRYWLDCWKKAFKFSGRARRSEYWSFVIWGFVANMMAGAAAETILAAFGRAPAAADAGGATFASYAYSVLAAVPGIAVCVRRLHDTGRTGWFYFLLLTPLALVGAMANIKSPMAIIWLALAFSGPVVLLYYMCQAGDGDENKFGENPKTGASASTDAGGLACLLAVIAVCAVAGAASVLIAG